MCWTIDLRLVGPHQPDVVSVSGTVSEALKIVFSCRPFNSGIMLS
jgi:hypothetical protein